MPYEHFTYYDRLDVQHGLRRGLSCRAIAKKMSRAPSSITREIRRNRSKNGQYDAMKVQMQCRARQKRACRVHKLEHLPLRDYVQEKLQEDWSPGCIVEMLALEHPEDTRMRVSHETIYQYVYVDKRQGGELFIRTCVKGANSAASAVAESPIEEASRTEFPSTNVPAL